MSQPFALPLKILYHRIIEKEINKCGEINARSVKRRIQYVNIETTIQKNRKTELLSFSNGQTTSAAAEECLFKKDNLKKIFQNLSPYREQQDENYKNLGVNLKPHFPNILCNFEHFRNNKH